jgi:feruloyl-CoA synthase
MTETSPAAIFGNARANGPGIVGVPIPGVELKLIRREDKFEALYRGPNVTPGYWRDPAATAANFDADGFFISGDLVSFVDIGQPAAGLRFEGRASDDFKLASGTRVSAGALRLKALDALAPLLSDAVIVGADRHDVRMLMFPDWARCARECGLPEATPPVDLASNPTLRAVFRERLMSLASESAGSAGRIAAAIFVLVPPSAAAGEVTEKGTINGRFLQRNRPDLMELLFGNVASDMVIHTAREHR